MNFNTVQTLNRCNLSWRLWSVNDCINDCKKLSTECEESIVITIKFNESAEWFCTSSRSKWSQTQRTHRNTSQFMHWHSCCDHLPAGRKRQRRKAPPSNSFILMTVQMPLALERSYLDIKRSCKSNVSVFLFSLKLKYFIARLTFSCQSG